jgi:hypothetical protein
MTKNYKNVVCVICPGNSTTGGVELLHQLVNEVNANDYLCFILYYPFSKQFSKPKPYYNYNCPVLNYNQVKGLNLNIILPEVYTYLIPKFNSHRIFLWWLSVDNYLNSRKIKFWLGNNFFPWNYYDFTCKTFSKEISAHLYQSEYAKIFLMNNGINNILKLGDFINSEFHERYNSRDSHERKNIILYNPSKGLKKTEKIINKLSSFRFVPIKGMSRVSVIRLMLKAKIYIDFGNHPGKDRIPREAAALGCAIVTNKRGSARNSVDIPIPSVYKIDDSFDDFEIAASKIILLIINNFSKEIKKFSFYRNEIKHERTMFSKDVKRVIKFMKIGR